MKTTMLAMTLLLTSHAYADPSPVVSVRERSPIDGAVERPLKAEAFINFQYIAVGKNGDQSFEETRVPIVYLKTVAGILARARGMTRVEFLSQDSSAIKPILMARYSYLGDGTEDAVDNILLINKITRMNSADMYKTLDQEMSHVSFGRKVSFLANFLSLMSDNYDMDTIGHGKRSVSDEQLISAVRESLDTGNVIPAGVCRHMHQLAVRYARAMGVQEAFGVGFSTTGGSGHRTLVLTHPDDPTTVVQLNYSGKAQNNGVSGPGALSQNHTIPDTGTNFRVYDGNDNLVIVLPSELGAILNIVTGGEDSDLSPNYRNQAQINQFGVATPYGTVRYFHANTPMGNQTSMTGGAYNIKIKYNDIFYGEYGIAGFTSVRPSQNGNIDSYGVYARMAQGFNWAFYSTNNLKLSTFAEVHFRGALFCATIGDEVCKLNMTSSIDGIAGAQARYRTGPLNHRTAFILQVQEGAGSNTEFKLPVVPVTKMSHDIDFNLGRGVVGNVGGAVTMYNLGTGHYLTYNGHAGISSHKTNTFVGLNADGRITKNTPFWLPAAEHQASAIVKQSIFADKLYVGVDGRQSFDVGDNRYIGLTLGGKF